MQYNAPTFPAQEHIVSAVFKKLNLKDQAEIVVIDPPASFEPELASLQGVAVRRSLDNAAQVQFSLAFVTQQAQIDALAGQIAARIEGDAVVWFAYPKASSKRYTCDFNRDRGWDSLGAAPGRDQRSRPAADCRTSKGHVIMTTIAGEHFKQALLLVLDETFDNVQGIYLDQGTSLFETLAGITAEEASIPVGGQCATLAAQVKHVAFYLEVVERAVRSGDYQQVDWGQIWRTCATVTSASSISSSGTRSGPDPMKSRAPLA